MNTVQKLLTEYIDVWTAADNEKKSGRGRSLSNGDNVYGIQKMRELILELAVRGKLVPQDPSDKSASELLKHIKDKKKELLLKKELKNSKPLPTIAQVEIPFSLPIGWVWERLGNLCVLENGDRGKNYPNKNALVDIGIPFVNAGHLQNGKIDINAMTYISMERFNILGSGKFREQDILYCLRGSLGKSALVMGLKQGAIASSLVIVRLFPGLVHRYILNYFNSTLSSKMVKKYDNGTAQPNLSSADLTKFLVPLPPLLEQHRIVAKVDELMTLCDQIETKHINAVEAHAKIVNHLLGTLTQSQNTEEFSENWQRIAAHFDILFTTESSIDALKQTILQLGVMGKLVPQDPNDEPARELLKRIQAEKAKLIAEGKIKKEKPLPPISEEEKPFELPKGWEWVRIGEMAKNIDYGLSEKTFESSHGVPVLKMGDIQDGKVILGGQKRLGKDVDDLPRLYLSNGDLLYNRTNSAELVGKTGIYEGPDNEYTFASYLIRIRCFSALFSPHYLNLAMNTPQFRETQIVPHVIQQCGQANVNGTIMKNMIVSVPPFNEQNKILEKLKDLLVLCDQLKSNIRKSNQLQQKLADAMVEQAVLFKQRNDLNV